MKYTKFIALGFILALFLHGLVTCESYGPEDDPGGELNVETRAMRKGAEAAQDAFMSGKVEEIRSVMTESSQEYYKDVLDELGKEHFEALGAAFANRELSASSELFAEYTFSEAGLTFTVTLAQQDGNEWKVVRF